MFLKMNYIVQKAPLSVQWYVSINPAINHAGWSTVPPAWLSQTGSYYPGEIEVGCCVFTAIRHVRQPGEWIWGEKKLQIISKPPKGTEKPHHHHIFTYSPFLPLMFSKSFRILRKIG